MVRLSGVRDGVPGFAYAAPRMALAGCLLTLSVASHAQVEVFSLGSSSTFAIAGEPDAAADLLITETYTDAVTGTAATQTTRTTVSANAAFGVPDMVLGSDGAVTVCKENGEWLSTIQSFVTVPYLSGSGTNAATVRTSGSVTVAPGGDIEVFNRTVGRDETTQSGEVRTVDVSRTVDFSIASMAPDGQSASVPGSYAETGVSIYTPSLMGGLRANNVARAQRSGSINLNLTLTLVEEVAEVPAECLAGVSRAVVTDPVPPPQTDPGTNNPPGSGDTPPGGSGPDQTPPDTTPAPGAGDGGVGATPSNPDAPIDNGDALVPPAQTSPVSDASPDSTPDNGGATPEDSGGSAGDSSSGGGVGGWGLLALLLMPLARRTLRRR